MKASARSVSLWAEGSAMDEAAFTQNTGGTLEQEIQG